MAEHITNAFHSIVGGAKHSLGKAVGSEQLAADGAAEKARADARSSTLANQAQAQDARSSTLANQAQAQNTQDTQGQVQGVADNINGPTKETTGAATGNTKLEAEGHFQQAAGDVQRTANQ
ncbi:hypothetical protein BGZ96_012439 [Linnemannia gamsii]|uniref:CsbD-like domain-containing protein n=1 Tax=Linnemannia gamsii TaxID=64522 RepID=A0ABQ7KDH3_9FUNG|nr:hypothetical protein BGZ96_012439 [Linnemannia gamsii]